MNLFQAFDLIILGLIRFWYIISLLGIIIICIKNQKVIKTLLDVLDPTITTRFWTVSLMGWSRGTFQSFWFKKNALKYAEESKNAAVFVKLKNESNDIEETLYDHSAENPAPSVVF